MATKAPPKPSCDAPGYDPFGGPIRRFRSSTPRISSLTGSQVCPQPPDPGTCASGEALTLLAQRLSRRVGTCVVPASGSGMAALTGAPDDVKCEIRGSRKPLIDRTDQ